MVYENVIAYCSKHCDKTTKKPMPVSAFEKMCGLKNGTVGKWKDPKRYPRMQTLRKLESATGIPVAKWVKE